MRRAWKESYRYSKAGVVTVDLVPLECGPSGTARNITTGETMTEAAFDAEERGKRLTFVVSPDDAKL